MFGMGFTEILMIAVVAILFLGPDKLPDAMVSVAKFIKGGKRSAIRVMAKRGNRIGWRVQGFG